MIKITNKSECSGCSACKNICPRNCITMVEDDKGFKYPKVNNSFCIKCGLCKKVCPIINKTKEDKSLPLAYAAINKNQEIRNESSSGGVFSTIAEYIINNNGVVFGATFNKEFLVEHIKVEDIISLSKLRGSKYIQSEIKRAYKEVQKILNENRLVLFTGTPCQIEGLKSYLQKDYDNLYTQDLICHGVPSKKVWKKYLEDIKKQEKCNFDSISFRNKANKGWSNYQLLFVHDNIKKYIDHEKDIFMNIFLSDIALRDSCYDCKFKKKHRYSDITLADFWGINNVIPEMNDEKGTSLVIVNSKKGEYLLERIRDNMVLKQVDFEVSIENNRSMVKSPSKHKYREEFFEDLEKLELQELVFKYIEKRE